MKTFFAMIIATCFVFAVALLCGMLGYSKQETANIIMFFGCMSGLIAVFRAD